VEPARTQAGFETLRAIGYAPYGGADIGEVVSTAGRIPEGDEGAWYEQWRALAERVGTAADASAATGRTVSAREAYLRSSNYYRLAEFYLRDDPDHDPRVLDTSRRSSAAFARAAELLPQPLTRVQIPYQGTALPGWWVPADPGTPDPRSHAAEGVTGAETSPEDPDGRRPVLLFHGGFDSTGEELYFASGAAAARRGYHALLIEGPGQGSVLREQHLPFRPDWDVVVTAAVDWLLDHHVDGVDPDAIALMGMSMGGLLAPRAAAVEHRLAALVAYDGVYSMPEAVDALLSAPLKALVAQGAPAADAQVDAALATAMATDTQLRWTFLNGMWVLGVPTPVELIRAFAPYTMADSADQITCPTLVLDAENDLFFAGQAPKLRDALTAPTTYHLFHEADGAGEHCQDGAMTTLHQVTFDWLDAVLPAPR